MTILQNRRTVFSLTNTDVMSSAAPSSEAGIEKSVGQDGFFIYTSKAFDLWFKDANGAWSLYDSYGLADITDGVAFSWNTNTAAFIQTQEANHQVAIFIIETKTVGSFGNQEQTSVSSAGLDRLKEHSNYKRIRMQNSGHTGEAYAIAIFDANGDASYVSAPVSGEREGKTLGWDENGDLGWITLATAPSFTVFGDTTETDGVYSLDGSGDYVTYGGDHQYTDQFSISVWFKSDGASNPFDVIVSNHDGGNIANGNAFSLYPNGKLRIKTADSGKGQSGDAMNVGSNLDDNSWHQLVVTWQANTTDGRNIYIDGSLVNQSDTGTAVYRTSPQSLMYLGGMWVYTTNSFSAHGFDGDITGFSIVNSILTAQQVSDSYVADAPPETMPETSFDNAQSSGVLYQGATNVNGMYIDNNSRGQGYLKGDWDASMRPDSSSDDFSFSAFWRFKAANNGDRSWIFGRNGNVSAGGWGIFATKVSNTSIKYEILKSGGNPWFQTAAITTTVLDEFHHVAFRYRDGEWFIYHDGVEVYTTTNKNFPTTNPSSGKFTLGNGWAVVMLDQIQFFKGGYLTTDQISSLASERSQKDIDYTNNT